MPARIAVVRFNHGHFHMAIRNITTPKINLNVHPGTTPLTMDMQQFFEFSFWMAEELLDLEAEFSAWQTPSSTRCTLMLPITAKVGKWIREP